MRALLLVLLIATPAAAQDGPPKPRGALGSEWVGADGNQRHAQLSLYIADDGQPDPLLYRRAEYDWRASQLQSGMYPPDAFAKEQTGTVAMQLAISADGRPVECTVTRPSGVAALDVHACPHLLRHTRYTPALDRTGTRVPANADAELSYSIRLMMMVAAGGPYDPPSTPPRKPRPQAPVTLETVGITPATVPPRDVYGISAMLRVEVDGNVSACTLSSPTRDDLVDKQVCDRLIALRFHPAQGADGTPVAWTYTVSLPWSR